MQRSLDQALAICASLDIPMATEKMVGPTTYLTLLGIEIDFVALEVCLPTAKLEALRETISAWQGKKMLLEERCTLADQPNVTRV